MTIDDILFPMTTERFLSDYVGEKACVIQGSRTRFHHLVTWDALNDTLSRLRVDNQRVALVRNAKPPSRDSYVFTFSRNGAQYLNGPAVMRHVLDGATLVVNQVDELFDPIRTVAEAFERALRLRAGVNLYAGWRREKGFDVHWDRHDTLILQVRGRKDWTIWQPTRLHPIEGDVVPAPTHEPFWMGILEAGDVLYMPRGWWHVAQPRDEPSLHLTIGLRHRTGLDMLEWIAEQMRSVVEVRADVPHWRDGVTRHAWLAAVGAAWTEVMANDPIGRYMGNPVAQSYPRPLVRLPLTSSPPVHPIPNDQVLLRLATGELMLPPRNQAEMLSFSVGDREWKCHGALRPALALLSVTRATTLAEMKAAIVDPLGRTLLHPFMTGLVLANVVWAEPITEDVETGGG